MITKNKEIRDAVMKFCQARLSPPLDVYKRQALESSQINCVDGSVLFASLLRSINIEPILVRTPGHMFVGYYTCLLYTSRCV